MKKVVVFVLFLLIASFLFGSETGDLLFWNIPWGTEYSQIEPTLKRSGFLSLSESEYTTFFDWRMNSKVYLSGTNIHQDVGKTISCYSFIDGFNVAGHGITSIELSLLYDHDNVSVDKSRFVFVQACIEFKVSDAYSDYEDLLNKLSTLYGQPKQYENNDSYVKEKASVWLGNSNSGIALVLNVNAKNSNYSSLHLYYGKTDINSLIDSLKKASSAQTILASQNNYNGLMGAPFLMDSDVLFSFLNTFGIEYNSSSSDYVVSNGTPNLWDYGNKTPAGWKLISIDPDNKCPAYFDEYGIAVKDGKVKAIVAQRKAANFSNVDEAYSEICSYINAVFGEPFYLISTGGMWWPNDTSDWVQINIVKTELWITLVIQSYDYVTK